jgi:hypothetical protein
MGQGSVTLQDFEKLCVELFKQKVVCDEKKELLKHETDKYDDLEAKVMAHMEANDKDKQHVKGFGLLYTVDRFTVTVPKDLEAKKALMKHFTEKGIFFEMVTVNSATCNSYYKSEMEAAVARGDVDFKVPGLGEPKHVRTLSMRKEK